jgi:hypothetical protein
MLPTSYNGFEEIHTTFDIQIVLYMLVVELKFITITLVVFLISHSLVSTFAKAPFYFKPALALGNLQTYKSS